MAKLRARLAIDARKKRYSSISTTGLIYGTLCLKVVMHLVDPHPARQAKLHKRLLQSSTRMPRSASNSTCRMCLMLAQDCPRCQR